MKRKFIYLSAYVTVPTEEAEERIQNATKKDRQVRDNKTPSRQWFIEQNLTPPDDAIDEEVDINGNIILDEEDLQEITVPVTIPLDNIGSYVASVDGGTRLYTRSNLAYDVEEEVWEIDAYIELLQMSWWDKQLAYFQHFLQKIKNKIMGRKEVNLAEIFSKTENQPDYKQE